MLLTDYTYYQGDSAITAMYQGDVKVYPLEPPVINNKIYYTSTDGNKVYPFTAGTPTFGAKIVSHTYGSEGGVITFDGAVTNIGYAAFNYCTTLLSIDIPDSVTGIGNLAFAECRSLSSITIPDSVTGIGSNAFTNCYNLLSVTIGSGVTSIGNRAFVDCRALSSVTIGSGVTSIGDWAFGFCQSLSSITYNNTMAQWATIAKGNYWHDSVPATVVHCSDGDVPI